FGPGAGLLAASLAALSDFHILYSRTALTDPVLCFWFLLAVYCGWRALVRNHIGEAAVAGLVVAAAWSTKYNGWLPLAVIVSGFIAWGVIERISLDEWLSKGRLLVIIAVVAALGWTPVWISLDFGRHYKYVASNHAKYFVGLDGWPTSLASQLA